MTSMKNLVQASTCFESRILSFSDIIVSRFPCCVFHICRFVFVTADKYKYKIMKIRVKNLVSARTCFESLGILSFTAIIVGRILSFCDIIVDKILSFTAIILAGDDNDDLFGKSYLYIFWSDLNLAFLERKSAGKEGLKWEKASIGFDFILRHCAALPSPCSSKPFQEMDYPLNLAPSAAKFIWVDPI